MNKISNPLISVVVPVYNVEKKLSRCIDSILVQSYTHFELLLINDGSKDYSRVICEEYALKDNRVRIFHKENGGASSARNVGIEQSLGEYICFIDSDDFVSEHYLSSFLVEALKKDKYTFVIQSLKTVIGDGIELKQNQFREGLYSNNSFSELFHTNEISKNGYSVCKLYNSELIKYNNIRFNLHINYCEDLLFMLDYLLYVKNVFISSRSNYYYIYSSNSLTNSYNSYETEIYTVQTIECVFKKLVVLYNLNNKAKDNFYKNTLGALLIRSISSLYRPIYKKPRIKRIVILRELYTKDYLNYFEKFTENGLIFHKIGFIIYKKKFFKLLDSYYLALYYLRGLFDKQWKKYITFRKGEKSNDNSIIKD